MAFIPDQRRRWFGLFYLIASAGMLIWGLTLLRHILRGWLFIAFWFACFLCAVLALVMAWLDLRAIRRHVRCEQRELLNQALDRIAREAEKSRPATEPKPPPAPPPAHEP